MASVCFTCKYFSQIPQTNEYENVYGICSIKLPAWVETSVCADRVVEKLDTCDFWSNENK